MTELDDDLEEEEEWDPLQCQDSFYLLIVKKCAIGIVLRYIS